MANSDAIPFTLSCALGSAGDGGRATDGSLTGNVRDMGSTQTVLGATWI